MARTLDVEKVAEPLFRVRLHEIFASISYEIVGKNFARSVIFEAHVLENDEIKFYSVVCGRRNSLQEGSFDKLSAGLWPALFLKLGNHFSLKPIYIVSGQMRGGGGR